GGLSRFYRSIIDEVSSAVDYALAPHSGTTVAEIFGASDTDVVALKRERNDIDAYLAYQDLGHAFHSTEDFFAHSNYVELMGGVNVGDSIAAKGVTTAGISVPGTWN